MPQIYSPREDSHLMERALKKKIPFEIARKANLSFLEIGSGSGILLETVYTLGVRKENMLGTDINEDAVEHCRKRGFDCKFSDLFGEVSGRYDIIAFNPPYLPKNSDEPEDSQISTTGGNKGNEIINSFLDEAKEHLKSQGKIFLLTSSITEEMDLRDYEKKFVEKAELFMETLYIWELSLKRV